MKEEVKKTQVTTESVNKLKVKLQEMMHKKSELEAFLADIERENRDTALKSAIQVVCIQYHVRVLNS